MNASPLLSRFLQHETVNFLLTNCLPRLWLTRLVGHISKSENPVVRAVSMGLWRAFSDLDLSEARTTQFKSMHDCFTRQLKDGARPVETNPALLTSPSDGIVGACGQLDGTTLLQAKGFYYTLADLLGDQDLAERYRDGSYVTLRLTSSMYHRFHAPHDCVVEQVRYFSGDAWNVNPAALHRVDRLFCRNERAVLLTRLQDADQLIALVPVAAILVASIRLHFLDVTLHLKYRGPHRIVCHAPFRKGDEMGWFEHGSTIIVIAPRGFQLTANVAEGTLIRMGQPLLKLAGTAAVSTASPSRTLESM